MMLHLMLHATLPANLEYLIASLVWSLAGLVVGFISGAYYAVRLCTPGTVAPRDILDASGRLIVGLLILAMVSLTMVWGYISDKRLEDQVACQRQFNQSYRQALQDNFAAQRKFLTVFAASPQLATIDQQRALAFQEYLRSLKDIPVDNTCGG